MNSILVKITENIVNPILGIIFLLAFVYFAWGVFKMIMGAGEAEKRKEGQDNVLYGVIGMTIMLSAYGIIRFIAATIRVDSPF
jgi:hypothetical protein